jgi:hypothetical protein
MSFLRMFCPECYHTGAPVYTPTEPDIPRCGKCRSLIDPLGEQDPRPRQAPLNFRAETSAEFSAGIVAMVSFQGSLYIATSKAVYRKDPDSDVLTKLTFMIGD